MVIFHPSIYFLDHKTLWAIIRTNFFLHYYWKRALSTVLLLLAILVVVVINVFCKLLDELIFIGYRKTRIHKPIFIISSPRSGTSYLQSLLVLDDVNFRSQRLYEVLFPSIIQNRIARVLGKIDQLLGFPFKQILDKVVQASSKGWKNIHRIGLSREEEDEGFWFLSFLSPAWNMMVPHYAHLRHLDLLDQREDSVKRHSIDQYKNFLKRTVYAHGHDKTLLVKSVLSSGRIEMIAEAFPDARFLYISRNPEETIPSYISMFSAPWTFHSPDAGISEYRELGLSAIDFYNHLKKNRNTLSSRRLQVLSYSELTAHSLEALKKVYDFLEIRMENSVLEKLEQTVSTKKKYKSKHKYSLSEFGFSEDEIRKLVEQEI